MQHDEELAVTGADLISAAILAREFAVAPHSGFRVGAAVVSADGTVYSGCNVEGASFGLTVCAERVAILKAVSSGAALIFKIAVVADAAPPAPPCGACRQMIWEFGRPDTEIILANLLGETERHTIAELLPRPFDSTVF